MCGCNKTYRDDTIAGMDETDMMLIGGAVVGYTGTAYIDNMLVFDKDGHKKTGAIAEKDTLRNGGYAVGGIALNWLIPDEPAVKGLGIGMTVYGIKELIRGQYPTIGIKGMNKNTKYIAKVDRRKQQQRYLGTSRSNRIDLGLNNANKQKKSLIVKHH